jgi:16S rRNA (guanine966-N2)-methyltransferase
MRIITGKYKGRILTTIRGSSVRPVTDRVKSTIYNVLQSRLNLAGARVLDLFAGSGSLGFEALSRGSASVVFVDDRREVLDGIEHNADALGCADDCVLLQTDARLFVERSQDRFDLIFADPPYAYDQTGDLPARIFGSQLLKNGGFLIIEHAKRTSFEDAGLYRLALQKEFGNTRVSFFVHASQPEVSPS